MRTTLLAYFVLSAAGAASAAQPASSPEAVQWTRWELTLSAGATPADPYLVKLGATFTGPAGQRIEAPGFYAGGGAFRIRIAFPAPGKWTWETNCDKPDPALHGRRGAVQVRVYSGPNPLFLHGFLQARPGARFLSHADGTPFLWMGDTAWYAGIKAAPADWDVYLADRAARRFSALHLAALRVPPEPGLPKPFDSEGRPNPLYWDALDRNVKAANRHGLLVLMVGLGRPNDKADEPTVASPAFARYVAARFFGDHVVFSPNFDGPYQPILDTVAENLRAATKAHLITQHPETRRGQNEVYLAKPYLSFSGLQSGHQGGRLEPAYGAAREWALNLWGAAPAKPVINIEAMYDGRGGDEGAAWRERDARKLGWITWLSGALGYTYGAGDTARKVPGANGAIWRWHGDETAWDYWRNALAWKSAAQMTVLRDFFASLEWWRIEPFHQVVTEPAESNQERAVFAGPADRSFGVAYSPVRRKLVLDMAHFPGPVQAHSIDPVSGARHAISGAVPNRGRHEFPAPESGDDWALLLTRVSK